MFDKMIEAAEKQGAEVHEWSQKRSGAGAVCSTIVSRWVKYQLLGKGQDFWTKIETSEGPEGYSREQVKQKLQRIQEKHKVLEEHRKKKFENYRQFKDNPKPNEMPPSQPISGEIEARNIQRRKSPKKNRTPLTLKSTELLPVHSEDDYGKSTLAPKQGACFIALQKVGKNTETGHFLGVHQHHDGRVSIFDPNMGEVTFKDGQEYAQWMNDFRDAWKQDDTYKQYVYWQGTTMTGWAQAQAEGRKAAQLKKEMLEYTQQEEKRLQEEELMNWSKSDFSIVTANAETDSLSDDLGFEFQLMTDGLGVDDAAEFAALLDDTGPVLDASSAFNPAEK